jgi:hypothetical protein
LALGVKHPSELNLSTWQIAEWDAYFELHPFGPDIDHFMLARIIAMVAGKNPAAYMPKVGETADPDEAMAKAYLEDLIRRGDC